MRCHPRREGCGVARHGRAGRGMARLGPAWHGAARHGKVRTPSYTTSKAHHHPHREGCGRACFAGVRYGTVLVR